MTFKPKIMTIYQAYQKIPKEYKKAFEIKYIVNLKRIHIRLPQLISIPDVEKIDINPKGWITINGAYYTLTLYLNTGSTHLTII